MDAMGQVDALLVKALGEMLGGKFRDERGRLPVHGKLRYERRRPEKIDSIVVHHSATPRETTWSSVAAYHVNSQGWPGIGYHLGVRLQNGTAMTSLFHDLQTWSYHARDWNERSVGVCVMGNFKVMQPTGEELSALGRVVAGVQYALGGNLKVVGHRDVPGNDTNCPGKNLYEALRGLTPPVYPDEPSSSLREALMSAAKLHQSVALNPQAALLRRMMEEEFVPVSSEFELDFGGRRYVGQLGQDPTSLAERVYWVVEPQWDAVEVEDMGVARDD